jgi:microsomal dipeptidase-like Zn-dependent dipeptidase
VKQRIKHFSLFLSLILQLLTGDSGYASTSMIELHAHLFMDEGMGWLFKGDFNTPLRATSWKNRFSSQANPEALNASQLDIVVATFYAHPLFGGSLKDSIRRQVRLAHQFVESHPDWILGLNPEQARSALASGKHVLILALEGAAGILESEEDLKEFIDQGGIRIVTLLHLTDDGLGGVAFLKGFRVLSSPFAFFKSLFRFASDSSNSDTRVRLNSNGLTQEGSRMAIALTKRKVWIDLSHASDASQKDLYPILAKAGQPLLYTHTVLRKYHGAERGISYDQLRKVFDTQGFIGLMPSEEMLEGTPGDGKCTGGVHAFATQFREASEVVGENAIGIGSDFNGGIPHLQPSCKTTGTSLDQAGLWQIGQSYEVWSVLKKLDVWHPEKLTIKNTDRFLDSWSILWRPSGI